MAASPRAGAIRIAALVLYADGRRAPSANRPAFGRTASPPWSPGRVLIIAVIIGLKLP